MEIQESKTIAQSVIDHWYLIVGAVVGGWYLIRKVIEGVNDFKGFIGTELEDKLPKVLKRELENGLGIFVKDKVRTEIESAFKSHEEREERQIKDTLRFHEDAYHRRKK